jgi:hypothetical protein
MKKIILLTTFSALAIMSFSQNFGVKAGLNLANMLYKNDEGTLSDDFKVKPGFHIGGIADIPLIENISVETGILLSSKGFRYDKNGVKFSDNLIYLDIPVTAKYSYVLNKIKLFANAGPNFGLGLSGKYKTEIEGDEDRDVKWGSGEENDLKRFDLGLLIGAGVQYDSYTVGLNYNLGLSNIAANTEGGTKIKNRIFGLSVGYMF